MPPLSPATNATTFAVMFRRIVVTSCLVGLLTGVLVAGLRLLVIVPIILEAETYEGGGMDAEGNAHTHGGQPDAGEQMTDSSGASGSPHRRR